MGQVWAGEHTAVGMRVAIKTLLPAAKCDRQLVARFRREANLLGRVRSDHVARVVDFLSDDEHGLVLVMDFVEGELLADKLHNKKLTVEETIDLGIDLAVGLGDLHRASVIHRDLKPENVILEPRPGGRTRAVIVDFGVSRLAHQKTPGEDSVTNITMANVTVGTIQYMAPEQLLGSRDVTVRSDVYAIGAILFRAITGEQVFGVMADLDYAKHKLHNEAPPATLGRFDRAAKGLGAVIAKAIKRRPDARYASAEDLLTALYELKEIARAIAIDLDAPTMVGAPPVSSEVLDELTTKERAIEERAIEDEPTGEPTARMSMADLMPEASSDQLTVMRSPDLAPASGVPVVLDEPTAIAPPASPHPSESAIDPGRAIDPAELALRSLHPAGPPTIRPEPARPAPIAIAGISAAIALVIGVVIGVAIHMIAAR